MALPSYLRGRDLTALIIYPAVVDSNGNFTVGTGIPMTRDQIEGVAFTKPRVIEEMTGPVTTQAHHEVTMYDTTVEITEILGRSSGSNVLRWLEQNYDHARLYIVWGVKTFQFDAVIGSYDAAISNKGKNIGRLSFHQIDNGTTNPIET